MKNPSRWDVRNPPPGYLRRQLDARLAAELIGVARGIVIDGVVTPAEISSLATWLDSHPEARSCFPGRELAVRLEEIMNDGVASADERAMFQSYLEQLAGEGSSADAGAGLIDSPPPKLDLDGARVVLTGTFAYGSRQRCVELLHSLGATQAESVTMDTDYLVIGGFGSPAWITSKYGRKIEAAKALQHEGAKLGIVDERHWLSECNRLLKSAS